jgi:hypothetical protein
MSQLFNNSQKLKLRKKIILKNVFKKLVFESIIERYPQKRRKIFDLNV